MSQCVKVLPPSTPVVNIGTRYLTNSVPLLGIDDACSSGLRIYTEAEIKALSSAGSAPDPERMADMQSLFYAFLLVLVLAWGAKQLLNLFSGDTTRD